MDVVSYLQNLPDNLIFEVEGSMPRTFVDILHAAMTNQFIILAVAIALFLLTIILSDNTAVLGHLWC